MTHEFVPDPCAAVLVVGGTRHLRWLSHQRASGAVIVQRLDGLNWQHRADRYGPRRWVRMEGRNHLMNLIRARLADVVIYQSEFSRTWWCHRFGPGTSREHVIYNGVRLSDASDSAARVSTRDPTMLMVEGNFPDDDYTCHLVVETHRDLVRRGVIRGSQIVGAVGSNLSRHLDGESRVERLGILDRDHVRETMSSAGVLLSVDRNAACPNVVIEALSCGLPVVGPDTGSLAELLASGGGSVAAVRGNPWRSDARADTEALADIASEILANRAAFGASARAAAAARFDVEKMTADYLDAIFA